MQREWKDDPKGLVKLLAYDTKAKTWGAVHYPLESKGAGWMGLSEITAHGAHVYIVERDNQIGGNAAVKRVYRVAMAEMQPAALGGALPVVQKELVRDLLPHLEQWNGYVQDKVEGFAIDAAGTAWAVTDNDGVDDASGETIFWSLGKDLGPQAGRLTIDAITGPVYVYRGTVLADEHFDFDSAALRTSDIDQLDLFAAYLGRAQSPRVLVKGYSDSIGEAGYNLDLSLKRAEAVRDYVAGKAGRVSAVMLPVGMGEADPVKDCPDLKDDALKACLAPNRRVTVTFAARERLQHPLIEQIAEVGPGQSIDLLAVEGVKLDSVKLGN